MLFQYYDRDINVLKLLSFSLMNISRSFIYIRMIHLKNREWTDIFHYCLYDIFVIYM